MDESSCGRRRGPLRTGRFRSAYDRRARLRHRRLGPRRTASRRAPARTLAHQSDEGHHRRRDCRCGCAADHRRGRRRAAPASSASGGPGGARRRRRRAAPARPQAAVRPTAPERLSAIGADRQRGLSERPRHRVGIAGARRGRDLLEAAVARAGGRSGGPLRACRRLLADLPGRALSFGCAGRLAAGRGVGGGPRRRSCPGAAARRRQQRRR
jgi:hypothetical protein